MEAFKRVVENMMNRYGGTATIITRKEGTYNPQTSEYTQPTEIRYTVKAIVMDLTLQSNGMQVAPNSLIQAGDKQVFIQPISNGITLPSLIAGKDIVRIGSDDWNIVTIKQVNPSGTNNALLELYVRK